MILPKEKKIKQKKNQTKKNPLQSPAPVCMFYFAHPFGIATPPVRAVCLRDDDLQMSESHQRNAKQRIGIADWNVNDEQHMAAYVPWPPDTWQNDAVLPPLIHVLQQRLGVGELIPISVSMHTKFR